FDELVFPCMAVDGGRVFCQTPGRLQCVDFETGKQLWTAELPMALPIPQGKLRSGESQWEAPTVVASGELVFVGDFKTLSAFSVADGRPVWTGSTASGYNSSADVFVIGDLVWTKGRGSERTGFDRLTGEQKLLLPTNKPYMHPRCYRNKATERFILLGDPGVQFLDVESGETRVHHWIRGTCQYGIMPANGLLYVTPDSCACNMKTKLNGLFALAAQREPAAENTRGPRLERGPAYGQVGAGRGESEDWPTYRHDARRSGMTATGVAPRLAPAWRTRLGGRLTSVVAAEGQVFVASIDTHTVYALDDGDGSTLWQYTAGGRVDSPPTVHKGLVLFGCADGWIYALRARDGQLAWRFRAAPEDRRVFVNGQLESVWPVHGSVLIRGDALAAAAGRSSYLDGGIHMYRLNPQTGEMISETVIFSPDPETGKQPADANTKDVRGVKSDILLAAGEDVYMRHVKVDFETGNETGKGVHLFTPLGFLDDTWWHRGYWVLSDGFVSHWSGWWRTGNLVPSGRIVSYDDSSVFGYGRDQYVSGNTGQWRGGEGYQLYSFDRTSQPSEPAPPRRNAGRTSALEYRWAQRAPMFVRAMVVANGTMFIAGPPDIIQPVGTQGDEALILENPEDAHDAWVGGRGALMWAVSCEDGAKLAEYKLDSPPVFDGMIAAKGRVYMALTSGEVLCLAGGP
ncbi:MAG: PQQ-binding-like beta-propeller repeat protein, partial [Armatimonadota bacterium]